MIYEWYSRHRRHRRHPLLAYQCRAYNRHVGIGLSVELQYCIQPYDIKLCQMMS